MKIAILGAAGARTPLIVQALILRSGQGWIGLDELALMDIDGERLDLIAALTAPLERSHSLRVRISRTTDARQALTGADFVITTFRVGGLESRIVDERVPLGHGILGQETTGPGGLAMALRTIPVLLDYVRLMRDACPNAWLINFANPAGLLAEAIARVGGWPRAVGICDAPQTMRQVAAAAIGAPSAEVFLDYFGLNHLGWLRAILYHGRDYLPQLIETLRVREAGGKPGLPFDADLLAGLGLIPNEYLYYYYYNAQAVQNNLKAGYTRGEHVAALNRQLYAELRRLRADEDIEGMLAAYRAYVGQRGQTYMVGETGAGHDLAQLDAATVEALSSEGYAGVALELIGALTGAHPSRMILNLPNGGSIDGMAGDDVVEIPALAERGLIRPLVVGRVPGHCLGLMQQVKACERLTIEAAVEGSYSKALLALSLHPLVRDRATAKAILDEYREQHGALFPALA